MTKIPLTLGKHYLLIDSPISFYLVDNEDNIVYRPSGVWQLDTWKLLPEKYQKDHPVYTLSLEYDESKLADGKEVLVRESDIDLGDGVAGVSGQSVMLTGINDSLLPIPVTVQNNSTEIAVNNLPDVQKVTVQNIPSVQNVYCNYKRYCSFYPADGEPANFSDFYDWYSTNSSALLSLSIFFIIRESSSRVFYYVENFTTIKDTSGNVIVGFVTESSAGPVFKNAKGSEILVVAFYQSFS